MSRAWLSTLGVSALVCLHACKAAPIYLGNPPDQDDGADEDDDSEETPIVCASADDCRAPRPYCVGVCVECRNDTDCAAGARCEPDGECD